jgi:hypothetical protein
VVHLVNKVHDFYETRDHKSPTVYRSLLLAIFWFLAGLTVQP